MKTPALGLFLLFATLAHAAPPDKIASPDPNDAAAAKFLPTSDFETGMTFSEVQAIIARKYADWRKTENRKAVNPKPGAESSTFINSIELDAPRSPGQSFISNIYRFHFTSPLSGSTLYGITRDVKFSHLPKDRSPTSPWLT